MRQIGNHLFRISIFHQWQGLPWVLYFVQVYCVVVAIAVPDAAYCVVQIAAAVDVPDAVVAEETHLAADPGVGRVDL